MSDDVKWGRRDVSIVRPGGEVAFAQSGVEAPSSWSDRAVEQCARIYFRARGGVRETSIKDMVERVVRTVVEGALKPADGVGTPLATGAADAAALHARLREMVLKQRFARNTPVWVNAGTDLPLGERPQCSACFIQSIEDNMESIMALQQSETALFRRGSGTGTNLTPLRPELWPLSRGGTASGPVSFARGFDGWAGVTKSGGSSRRAAKMWLLNAEHPDVEKYIQCKVLAGEMTAALVAAGWNKDFNEPATAWIPYQNANNSVRVSDAFMAAVNDDLEWELRWGAILVKKMRARALWEQICKAAWSCGDPGLQFSTTINEWHTSPAGGDINASNPCGEYLFLDDSACNLASLRLGAYLRRGSARPIDADLLEEDVAAAVRSQDAVVGLAGYPTEKIARNSRDYRPLGLGYCDLGGLLMRLGIPYASQRGRDVCGVLTSLLSARAYVTSAEITRDCGGPFPAWESNRDTALGVVAKHLAAAESLRVRLARDHTPDWVLELAERGVDRWVFALELGTEHGFRNAQLTVLAPTGTIGFMMDADTTGIEPAIGLLQRKKLAAGGEVTLACDAVGDGLRSLGYHEVTVANAEACLRTSGELPFGDGASEVREEHRDVFRTALGVDVVSARDHVLMVAAAQPFVSGGISKTVNLPSSATPEDVSEIYLLAHELGVKCISVYRDKSKSDQPVSVGRREVVVETMKEVEWQAVGPLRKDDRFPQRRRMSSRCKLRGCKITIGGTDKFYFKVGLFDDDVSPGEVWITAAKPGSLVHGLLDGMAVQISLGLQHGVPLQTIIEKLRQTRFPPDGFTDDPAIRHVTSCLDGLGQWLTQEFPAAGDAVAASPKSTLSGRQCRFGCAIMIQDGACQRCPVCSDSTGGCGG